MQRLLLRLRIAAVGQDHGLALRSDYSPQFQTEAPRPFGKLRRIRYYDAGSDLSLAFFTNSFALTALTIAAICRRRREIELFFRGIKQHLRLRCFFAGNTNGVSVQIWAAITSYLLVAIAKREMSLPGSPHQVLQIVPISGLEKKPLRELFSEVHATGLACATPVQMQSNSFC